MALAVDKKSKCRSSLWGYLACHGSVRCAAARNHLLSIGVVASFEPATLLYRSEHLLLGCDCVGGGTKIETDYCRAALDVRICDRASCAVRGSLITYSSLVPSDLSALPHFG